MGSPHVFLRILGATGVLGLVAARVAGRIALNDTPREHRDFRGASLTATYAPARVESRTGDAFGFLVVPMAPDAVQVLAYINR
jgi:hypothetical protein